MIVLSPNVVLGQGSGSGGGGSSVERISSSGTFTEFTGDLTTQVNILSLLNDPSSLAPLFTDRLKPENKPGHVLVKVSIFGNWTTSASGSVTIRLSNSNLLYQVFRSSSATPLYINFSTFFSLAVDDVIAKDGSVITIESGAATPFRLSNMTISAEQLIFN